MMKTKQMCHEFVMSITIEGLNDLQRLGEGSTTVRTAITRVSPWLECVGCGGGTGTQSDIENSKMEKNEKTRTFQ